VIFCFVILYCWVHLAKLQGLFYFCISRYKFGCCILNLEIVTWASLLLCKFQVSTIVIVIQTSSVVATFKLQSMMYFEFHQHMHINFSFWFFCFHEVVYLNSFLLPYFMCNNSSKTCRSLTMGVFFFFCTFDLTFCLECFNEHCVFFSFVCDNYFEFL
jgi:hypothetical protein